MKEYWTSLASLLGVFAFCQSLLQIIFPPELRFAAVKLITRLFNNVFSTYCYFDITEIDGVNTNELYNAVQLYLSSSVSLSGSRLSLTRAINSTAITFGLSNNDSIHDTFNGTNVLWEHVVAPRQTNTFSWRPLPEEKRGFTLRIRKQDKPLILNSYLDFIMEKANDIRRRNQDRLLYTNSRGGSLDSRGHPWESVPFKHPSTFETLAIETEKKTEIMEDLQDFANGQMFYQKTGRAWKRGYLLFGPPGTGKSSMIAAMANFLGYDIYDLELSEVNNNSELRKLLMKTSSKSIIVIEDIDCSINLDKRKQGKQGSYISSVSSPVSRTYYEAEMRNGYEDAFNGNHGNNSSITLSGLLNFTDGLWSCCGSERIFVFTTNHVEKLDPALLRSGRMDMHIYMSHCGYEALLILLKNYLGFVESDLDEEVLKGFRDVVDKAKMTPADISEVLIKNKRDKEKAVLEVLEVLKSKALKNGSGGNNRVKGGEESDEEEQEKRALENPKEDGEVDEEAEGDELKKGQEVEEEGKK